MRFVRRLCASRLPDPGNNSIPRQANFTNGEHRSERSMSLRQRKEVQTDTKTEQQVPVGGLSSKWQAVAIAVRRVCAICRVDCAVILFEGNRDDSRCDGSRRRRHDDVLERCPYPEHHREIAITLEHLQRLQALLNTPSRQNAADLIRLKELKRSIVLSTVPMPAHR
jgi:hypothetical protein